MTDGFIRRCPCGHTMLKKTLSEDVTCEKCGSEWPKEEPRRVEY